MDNNPESSIDEARSETNNPVNKRKGFSLREKLIAIFTVVKIIPLILLAVLAWVQIVHLGEVLSTQAIDDSSEALNHSAVESIERITTDSAGEIADFLYSRDSEISYLASLEPNETTYRNFAEQNMGKITDPGTWELSENGMEWVQVDAPKQIETTDVSTNAENNDTVNGASFNHRSPDQTSQKDISLYDEITFIDTNLVEQIKIVANNTSKTNYPLSPSLKNINQRENTYVKAETYGSEIANLKPGEIYVSDVIGAYVPSHFIGMYTPKQMCIAAVNAEITALKARENQSNDVTALIGELTSIKEEKIAALDTPTEGENQQIMNETATAVTALIDDVAQAVKSPELGERLNALKAKIGKLTFNPEEEAYAGMENPNGKHFEGIVRWVTPVTDDRTTSGNIIGYVSFALNVDHIDAFVDNIDPLAGRYTTLPNAYEGNYAFIWDYQCRSIAHPRNHSIVGYDPETGLEQIPWLETSIYNNLLDSVGGDSLSDLQENWSSVLNDPQTPDSSYKGVNDLLINTPVFDNQSRTKKPAADLTAAGLVGLDGRYLNNAPQCTGWMDLTKDGGSGSFYILWSGLYKLTTAAAIPYYTGQYAPSEDNDFSKRGFAMLTIGAGLESFQEPVTKTSEALEEITTTNLNDTILSLTVSTIILIILVIIVAILLANNLSNNIRTLINGIKKFRSGQRQFRFRSQRGDEFGQLADSFDDMAESIVDSVASPLCITDNDLRIIYMNEEALQFSHATLEDVIGKPYGDYSIYPHDSEYDPILAFEKGGEAKVYFRKENEHYYKGSAARFTDKEGTPVGYYVITQDVTEIQVARENAEQANVAKTSFLSNMSHEMRTPMNAIVGMTTIGLEAEDTEKKDYCFDKISNASQHLLGVINDILDISKIEASKFELSDVEFEFEKMLQRVITVNSYRIEEKDQEFVVVLDPAIPTTLIADDQRLSQVITNLLTNASKFTPEKGTVKLETKLLADDGDTVRLQISVIDNGIGIGEEQKERIFEEFEQAENYTTRRYGGTGLGLAISKRIVELMGGNIWVESEPNKGSTFAFTVEVLKGVREGGAALLNDVNWDSVRLLVVDDDAAIREFFSDLMQRLGVSCDLASSGQEALEMIEKNEAYDIYFIDWRMPDMDGIELSRIIQDNTDNKSVIIMISATEWNTIEPEARKAGVDLYLSKPLFPSSIVNSVNDCIGAEGAQKSAKADSDSGATSSVGSNDKDDSKNPNYKDFRILLAEDMRVNREVLMTLLKPTEVEIVVAEDGAQVVEKFTADPEAYDLIFMDIQMPNLDGYEATRKIRAFDHPAAQNVPIVAMTANVFREDVEKCLAAGMNDHIGKPINLDEVLERLRKYLRRK